MALVYVREYAFAICMHTPRMWYLHPEIRIKYVPHWVRRTSGIKNKNNNEFELAVDHINEYKLVVDWMIWSIHIALISWLKSLENSTELTLNNQRVSCN